MLLAIGVGYVVMVLLLAPPTGVTCRISFILFCLSVAMLYGPLLVRALRIFRIFEASKKSAARPKYVETMHQLIFCLALIVIQVTAKRVFYYGNEYHVQPYTIFYETLVTCTQLSVNSQLTQKYN
jgi:hypothetical protein